MPPLPRGQQQGKIAYKILNPKIYEDLQIYTDLLRFTVIYKDL